jgi:FkbH-like protein
VDIDKEFSKFGFSNTFDKRNWYFARCRLSNTGLKVLSDTIKTVLKNHFTPAKKVLVLDCDNTLWGGVVGEDGVKGLKLGQDGDGKAYQDFQRAIKFHQKNGIILALNSKNNDRDVWKVFLNHREMILKKKDIISSKINWNEKFDNLIAISKELDLNLDSFVFWDDNPIEREKVKKNLPQVDVIDVADEVNQWADQLYTLDQFAKLVVTKEDLRKTNQYKSRAKFLKAINISKNEIDYLKSIKLKPKILKIDKYNLSRAEQLCMKTNQFNLRTTRYKANEIQHLSKNMQNIVFLTNLEDIYGNHGIISLVIVKKIDNEIAFLDSFLMSCRILGRHLESWIINETIKKCKQRGYKILISEYIPTQKNLMVKNFTSKNGFTNNINNKKILNLFKKNKKNITFAELKKVKIPYLDVYK